MELDFAELKPSLWNLALILLAVMIVVPLAKWFFNDVIVLPGITNLVNMI